MNEIKGDLINLAKEGKFDAIAHGVSCMCTMRSGIAPQMVKAFGCDKYGLEKPSQRGNINKLGQIQSRKFYLNVEDGLVTTHLWHEGVDGVIFYKRGNKYANANVGQEVYRKSLTDLKTLHVINAYTQYNYGSNHVDGTNKPLDYEAITLCMRKINHEFKGLHIGLPLIGCGLAGGDWEIVKEIIADELTGMKVTIVHYDK